MNPSPPLGIWLLALLSICLSAGAQLLMKIGMSELGGSTAGQPLVRAALSAVFQPRVFMGLACYGLSAALWLVVLSRMPLSLAYPLVSLAIVMVIAASALLLGEPLPAARILGSFLIVSGVALIGLKG
jgi:drug/metabolite transporter (DMT)-like permease